MRSESDAVRISALGSRRSVLVRAINEAQSATRILNESQLKLVDIAAAKLSLNRELKTGELQWQALVEREKYLLASVETMTELQGQLADLQLEFKQIEIELKIIDSTIHTLEEGGGSPKIGLRLVFEDNFLSLSLRTGGPTPAGYAAGKGTWAPVGLWYVNDPRGFVGFGHDWFVDPTFDWQSIDPEFPPLGMLDITADGLILKGSAAFPAIRSALPVTGEGIRFLSSLVSTIYSAKIKPPFYRETTFVHPGGPADFAAIWGLGNKSAATASDAQYEIDDFEYFGTDYEQHQLHSAFHLLGSEYGDLNYGTHVDVGRNFERVESTVGVLVTADALKFYFNDHFASVIDIGDIPGDEYDQLMHHILNLSIGMAWKPYPADYAASEMIVRCVRYFAPADNVSGEFPPAPPVPVITWRDGFDKNIPATTLVGAVVADLSGAETYTVHGVDLRFAIQGTTLVLVSAVAEGSIWIRGVDADGMPAYAPRIDITTIE